MIKKRNKEASRQGYSIRLSLGPHFNTNNLSWATHLELQYSALDPQAGQLNWISDGGGAKIEIQLHFNKFDAKFLRRKMEYKGLALLSA